jgi:hypothetical protein
MMVKVAKVQPSIWGLQQDENSLTFATNLSILCPWKVSKTSMICFYNRAPGTFSTPLSTIWEPALPSSTLFLELSSQKFVFLESFFWKLQMVETCDHQWWLSTNIMVYHSLSTPVILTWTDLLPTWSVVVSFGMSNHIGVWSVFLISERR